MSDHSNYGYFSSYNFSDNTELNYSKIDADYVESAIEAQDKFLKSVEYDKDSKELVFVFHTSDGDNTVSVSVEDLVDTYTAGDGIAIEDNVISCDVNLSDYSTTEDMNTAISEAVSTKADSDDVYTKEEVDDAVAGISVDLSDYSTTEDMNTAIASAVESKQDALTAGDNITIEDNTISVSIDLTNYATKEYAEEGDSALEETLNEALDTKQNTLTAGENITIEDNTISANIDLTDYATKEYAEEGDSALETTIYEASETISKLQATVAALESKIATLTAGETTQSVNASENAEETTYEGGKTVDFNITGDITNSITITSANTVTIDSDTELKEDSRIYIKEAKEVVIDGLTVSGEFSTETGNPMISIQNCEYVTVKNLTFNSDTEGYNGIEIGLNSTTLPKSVLVDNCTFDGSLSNNCILVFGTQENAVITVSNCTFNKVAGCLRLSNSSNVGGVTVNMCNCTVNGWADNLKYDNAFGILFGKDNYSASYEKSLEENRFGDDKIKVYFTNVVCNGEKVAPDNVADVCYQEDTDDHSKQVVYINYGKSGESTLIPYDEENKKYYFNMTFK